MKLLEQTARTAAAEPGREDVVVLHINHCMDNTFFFNDVLRSLFAHVTLLTPPYSNQDIPDGYPGSCYHGVRRDGVYHLMRNRAELGCCGMDFLSATMRLLEEAFRRELLPLLHQGKKLLIMEDGGYHSEALPRLRRLFPELEGSVIGVVEQTTSGTRRSMSRQGYRYAYPCASVARSDIKMHVESIFIGQRIVEELALMLYEADAFFPFHSVLLVGYLSCRPSGRHRRQRLCPAAGTDCGGIAPKNAHGRLLFHAEKAMLHERKPPFLRFSSILIQQNGFPGASIFSQYSQWKAGEGCEVVSEKEKDISAL